LDGRRLIALDARGHGQSDWSLDEEYGGDQHFADVSLAMENLGIERCVVAGFSMGGGVAIMVAAALPERVAGTAIIDAYPHPNMTSGSRQIAGWVSNYDPSANTFDPAISRHFREQLAAGREDRLDLWPLWEAIVCPVLVVRGGLSDVLTADNAAEMIARQPRADLVTFEDVGHRVPMQRPRELAELLEAFALRAE
jgi:pimeloyl-ACP methyl ester carboxylesterase